MNSLTKRLFFAGVFVLVEVVMQISSRGIGWGSENRGFSFGLGQNFLPGVVYLALATGLLVWIIRRKESQIGWWMIVAGGLANGVARMLLGSVWDYFHWNYGFSLWFNSADIMISMGVLKTLWKILS